MDQFQILLRQKNNPMNLESQCVSLELAKQLKEAGVPQKSLFYWHERRASNDGSDWKDGVWLNESNGILSDDDYEFVFSAFTVAELGELLTGHRIAYGRTISVGWGCWFGDDEAFYDEHEANCRAKMLLYLVQNNLINPSTLSEGR